VNDSNIAFVRDGTDDSPMVALLVKCEHRSTERVRLAAR
jgi:hypothetical protein